MNTKHPNRHWRCDKFSYGCRVTVRMLDNGQLYFKSRLQKHNHPPPINLDSDRFSFNRKMVANQF